MREGFCDHGRGSSTRGETRAIGGCAQRTEGGGQHRHEQSPEPGHDFSSEQRADPHGAIQPRGETVCRRIIPARTVPSSKELSTSRPPWTRGSPTTSQLFPLGARKRLVPLLSGRHWTIISSRTMTTGL